MPIDQCAKLAGGREAGRQPPYPTRPPPTPLRIQGQTRTLLQCGANYLFITFTSPMRKIYFVGDSYLRQKRNNRRRRSRNSFDRHTRAHCYEVGRLRRCEVGKTRFHISYQVLCGAQELQKRICSANQTYFLSLCLLLTFLKPMSAVKCGQNAGRIPCFGL